MSIFLLKSDGGAPQNMCFNVFVILVCSIYGENNIWHVKSWRFTLAVEVSQTALCHAGSFSNFAYWCAILIAHQIVMAKHGGSCVHFSGISTCGRTSRETVSHPQCPPLPTLCKISLPIYVIVTNKLLEPLTTTWYDSLVLSFSFLKI